MGSSKTVAESGESPPCFLRQSHFLLLISRGHGVQELLPRQPSSKRPPCFTVCITQNSSQLEEALEMRSCFLGEPYFTTSGLLVIKYTSHNTFSRDAPSCIN